MFLCSGDCCANIREEFLVSLKNAWTRLRLPVALERRDHSHSNSVSDRWCHAPLSFFYDCQIVSKKQVKVLLSSNKSHVQCLFFCNSPSTQRSPEPCRGCSDRNTYLDTDPKAWWGMFANNVDLILLKQNWPWVKDVIVLSHSLGVSLILTEVRSQQWALLFAKFIYPVPHEVITHAASSLPGILC